MEYMENPVPDEGTENVEIITTEEKVGEVEQITQPKTYTQEEVDSIVGERVAREKAKSSRKEARIRKEYEHKYGELESVLRAGTGKEDVAEMTDAFKHFYESKGIQMPAQPSYSEHEISVLARAEAQDIIKGGFDDVVEEVERLAGIGAANMNPKEKKIFRELAEYRKAEEETRELAKIGVSKEVYASSEFKEFASQFNSGTAITKIYEIYNKMQPKKQVQPMGSMRNGQESKVKDFYTQEEIERLTDEDLDDEEVWNAVRRSMTGKS